MSRDVENALIQIAQHYGGNSVTEAVSFVDKLREEGRYLLDVY
jgi:sulfite reductase alpha subunit-like flavoprotein